MKTREEMLAEFNEQKERMQREPRAVVIHLDVNHIANGTGCLFKRRQQRPAFPRCHVTHPISFPQSYRAANPASTDFKGGISMSKEEKTLYEKLGQLPPALQDRFEDQIDGAAMALAILAPQNQEKEADE